jgi:hypothetical protein
MTNPLIQAYRKPALYVSLPSGGKYYKEKPKLSVDSELAIYSMTARDELVSKTPDALFNGEATFSLIKSCAPDIADAHDMPVNDLMVVLIGIRMASYGDTVSVDLKCPKCQHLNQLGVSTNALLASVTENTNDDFVTLDNKFKINCKPYSLKDRTLLQIQRIKQGKLIDGLGDETISDEERQTKFGETFIEIADITVTLIANAITQVSPPEGEKVTDHELILEWLKTITKDDYEKIKDCIENLSENNIDTNFEANCQSCEHNWKTSIDLDIANFFVG